MIGVSPSNRDVELGEDIVYDAGDDFFFHYCIEERVAGNMIYPGDTECRCGKKIPKNIQMMMKLKGKRDRDESEFIKYSTESI